MAEENKIRDAADAIKGVVQSVPIYQDVAQPAAKEIGTALQTVAKTVHIALTPISGLVWGYEQIKEFVSTSVAERLKKIPNEKIITPSPQVAGPALESLKYAGHEENLREMYANLLATAMNADRAKTAHPGFVEIIRQLTSDEAKILQLFYKTQDIYFPLISIKAVYKDGGERDLVRHFSLIGADAGCAAPGLTQQYLDNICRLGLAEIPFSFSMTDKKVYERLKNYTTIVKTLDKLKSEQTEYTVVEEILQMTNFGIQFCNACIASDLKPSGKKELSPK